MKIDRIHFYTQDAVSTKEWFIRNIGFSAITQLAQDIYSSINNNNTDRHTHTEIVSLNSVCLAFSSPLNNDSPVAKYLNFHPSGVVDITFRVSDIQSIIDRAVNLGLKIFQPIQIRKSSQGEFKQAQIQGWNFLKHTLIEQTIGNSNTPVISNRSNSHITNIDHVVLNVTVGKIAAAVQLYQALFGFKIQQSFSIHTKTSGLYSQALIDQSGRVQFNINEPASPNSQIQEFIDFNGGSGIQHLALRSQNIIEDVARMQRSNIDFLQIPHAYYGQLDKTLNLTIKEWQAIAQQQILVDRDCNSPNSLLMQIFTQPIFEQPTFFLEFIERRHQARGFGQGNFRELFAAVERVQSHQSSEYSPITSVNNCSPIVDNR